MGCSPMSRNCGVYRETTKVFAPNPDPVKFNVHATLQVGRHTVAKVTYPDCTNYEGEKILLYLCTTSVQILSMDILDPHFDDNEEILSPFARFEPTDDGWDIAVKVAGNIK